MCCKNLLICKISLTRNVYLNLLDNEKKNDETSLNSLFIAIHSKHGISIIQQRPRILILKNFLLQG